MITIPSAQSIRSRFMLTVGAAALICASLAACSSVAGTTSAPTGNAQPTSAANPSSASGTPASDPSAAAASGSACGLVTISEVTTATGKPMAAGAGAGDICSFSATGDPSLVVYIQVYANAETLAVARQVESSGQHITGLGDDAFWTVAGNLFVQKGNRGFTITLPSLALTSRTAPPRIVMLAAAALARL
jgi:hypothetical protein